MQTRPIYIMLSYHYITGSMGTVANKFLKYRFNTASMHGRHIKGFIIFPTHKPRPRRIQHDRYLLPPFVLNLACGRKGT